jgi:hypothetical protein
MRTTNAWACRLVAAGLIVPLEVLGACEGLTRMENGNGRESVYEGIEVATYQICRQKGSGIRRNSDGKNLALEVYVDDELKESLPWVSTRGEGKNKPMQGCVVVSGNKIQVQPEGGQGNVRAFWTQYARCYP